MRNDPMNHSFYHIDIDIIAIVFGFLHSSKTFKMNNAKRTLPLAQMLFREFSKSAPRSSETVTPKFHRLKEVQKKFGVEDNVPVHLKGGITDKLLYQFTVLVTLTGVGLSFQTFYRLINK